MEMGWLEGIMGLQAGVQEVVDVGRRLKSPEEAEDEVEEVMAGEEVSGLEDAVEVEVVLAHVVMHVELVEWRRVPPNVPR